MIFLLEDMFYTVTIPGTFVFAIDTLATAGVLRGSSAIGEKYNIVNVFLIRMSTS